MQDEIFADKEHLDEFLNNAVGSQGITQIAAVMEVV